MDETLLKQYLDDINKKLDRIENRISEDHDTLLIANQSMIAMHKRLDELEAGAKGTLKLDLKSGAAILGLGGLGGGSISQAIEAIFK